MHFHMPYSSASVKSQWIKLSHTGDITESRPGTILQNPQNFWPSSRPLIFPLFFARWVRGRAEPKTPKLGSEEIGATVEGCLAAWSNKKSIENSEHACGLRHPSISTFQLYRFFRFCTSLDYDLDSTILKSLEYGLSNHWSHHSRLPGWNYQYYSILSSS